MNHVGSPFRVSERSAVASEKAADSARYERWFVAHTLPRLESTAEFQLQRQGFHTYLPWMKKTVRHARKITNVRAPAFSRYIFVRLDLDQDRWRSINGTIGVSSLVMANTMPLAVPAGVVENLITYTDELGNLSFDRDLKPGQKVRLISGPFAEAIVRLQILDGNGRARVLLEIMNSEISVRLQRSWLEAS